MFVYSAYYDARDIKWPVVRVIGVTQRIGSNHVKCRMFFDEKIVSLHVSDNRITKKPTGKKRQVKPYFDVSANIAIIGEHHDQNYSACFVMCPLNVHLFFANSPSDSSEPTEKVIPTYVSIIPFDSENVKVTNRLPVINSKNGGTGTYPVNTTNIGMCVAPVHSFYNSTLEIIEFVELYKILGVTRFTIYNHTMSDEVSCVLNHYIEKENSVSVMPWNLIIESNIDVHNKGFLAYINDCLYRNMNDFHYLIPLDLDEFIIPHIHDTIPDMLQYLNYNQNLIKSGKILSAAQERRFREKSGRHLSLPFTYVFQNAFFFLQFGERYH